MTNPLLEAFWNSRILKAPANTRESESSSEMISIYFLESNDFSWGEKIGKYPYSAGFVGPD